MKITVLGLGRMGRELAGRLLAQGHDVTVWNRSPGKAAELVAQGAREARDVPEAVEAGQLVMTMLANDQAVRAVAFGAGHDGGDGLVGRLGEGAVYADCSTVSPRLSAELASAVRPERFVAMPILGAPAAVAAGTAVYLVGGPDQPVELVRPALDSLTRTFKRYPLAPMATTAKLASNLLLLSGVVALAESLAVGRAGGLGTEQLRDLLAESPLVAPALRNRFESLLTGGGDVWWTTVLGAKDAGLAVQLARAAGIDLPVTSVVQDRYLAAAGAGAEDEDIVAVAGLYR